MPFRGETLGSLCVAIANAKFAPPSELRADLPAALDRWCETALASEPQKRHASAKEMALALQKLLEKQGLKFKFNTTAQGAQVKDGKVKLTWKSAEQYMCGLDVTSGPPTTTGFAWA